VGSELPADGGDAEAVLTGFAHAGVDEAALAAELQRAGTRSFNKSWNDLMECIASKSARIKKIAQA
jgi:transaldolase